MRGYLAVDLELRGLLFGNDNTSSGLVKGEAARLRVAALLNENMEWAKAAHARLPRVLTVADVTSGPEICARCGCSVCCEDVLELETERDRIRIDVAREKAVRAILMDALRAFPLDTPIGKALDLLDHLQEAGRQASLGRDRRASDG